MEPNDRENTEKSNEEKAAEIVADAIRAKLTLPNSADRFSPDENLVEVLYTLITEVRRVADALEEANEHRGRG